ncbi:MAG: hypothetical protein JNM50_03605 [Chromatiales bacterium]|jgi:hypothetical protein|nr:hypothetical protein [Chromatiales bacterium]
MTRHLDYNAAAHQTFIPGEDLTDFRTRVRAAQAAQVAERTREIAEQSSSIHAPGRRIRLWERLHHTLLPTQADHGLVSLIARATNLSVDDVHDEQQRRATRPTPLANGVPTLQA